MPRKAYVRQMFDEIAPSYDRLNHLLSLDVDKLWRRHALKYIVDGTQQRILDIACGTGDSTIAIAKAAAPGSRVTGADISEGMMQLVCAKASAAGVSDIVNVEYGDCEALTYPDDTFDRVTCAFGVRNFEHRAAGLAEMYRVLRPGGRAVILELSVPSSKPLRALYDLYFSHILPFIGGLVSGDRQAYRYLPASVKNFPSPETFCAELTVAGFVPVTHRSLTLGLCRIFIAEKPSA